VPLRGRLVATTERSYTNPNGALPVAGAPSRAQHGRDRALGPIKRDPGDVA